MKTKSFTKSIFILIPICFAQICFGQETAPLTIGSKAPEINAIWLKGDPITKYEKNKLYVVEFWATWCGPCKAAMPHLSELARKYKDKVVFTGINIWENRKGEDKPYESYRPAVTDFVKNMGNKMDYNVAMDNNELFMSNHWTKAAQIKGIPSTFLIKNDSIIWIGHPLKLDSILIDVYSGKYDSRKFKQEYSSSKELEAKKLAPFLALNKLVESDISKKEYSLALRAIDSAVNTIDTVYKQAINALKFTTLLEFDHAKAIEFGKEWNQQYSFASTSIAYIIVNKEGLPKETYQFGIACCNLSLTKEWVCKPITYELISKLYYMANEMQNAITAQEKAIEEAKIAIANGQFKETVTNELLEKMRGTLKKYQTK